MPLSSSSRPHDPGNDYNAPGIYLITLVVRGRRPVLGRLNMDARNPGVELTPLGEVIRNEWEVTPAFQTKHGRQLRILAQSVMPDHWHTVVEVLAPMDKPLGFIVQGYKSVCTSRWRKLRGLPSIKSQTCMSETLSHMSVRQRAQFYASPEGVPYAPLFDDDYDDTICLKVYEPEAGVAAQGGGAPIAPFAPNKVWHYDQRHLDAMVHYVDDNPRRAIIRKLYPEYMRRCLHLQIAGRSYGAFGNLFLLKWPDKRPVIVHRKAQPGQTDASGCLYPYGTPYVETIQYEQEKQTFIDDARSGQCVLVSAGISEGEKQIKTQALTEGLPFIHMQREPIGPLWKPERSRFDACTSGNLLILAPWQIDGAQDYDQFHNMNHMVQEVSECGIEVVIKHGL